MSRPSCAIESGEIHVWLADLRRLPRGSSEAFVREVLSAYIGEVLQSSDFAIDRRGKPRLPSSHLEFNLTHSGERAALAVATRTPVGIDIETIRTARDPLALARRFFAPEEAQELAVMPPDRRDRAFLTVWTRKEAFVKGVGVGLSGHLGRFRVSCDPDLQARLLAVDWDPNLARQWQLRDLRLAEGWIGALAVGSPIDPQVTIRTWPIADGR